MYCIWGETPKTPLCQSPWNDRFIEAAESLISQHQTDSEEYLQSAKILLLPSKYEIIKVPSNHSFFQYCNIAPYKVITLNPL